MMKTHSPKLVDRVRQVLRTQHYALDIEKAYINWIKRFIFFHNVRHPAEMGVLEIEAFLANLAVNRCVASSTQNQALAAILFLYQQVLRQELDRPINAIRAKTSRRLPVVMSQAEVKRMIAHLKPPSLLMAQLMYGVGLCLMECVRLRLKDVDFEQHQLLVRDGKGRKDRDTLLPDSVIHPLHSAPDSQSGGPTQARPGERVWSGFSAICAGRKVS